MLNWGRNWGRDWGRDIWVECQTAACIGPHHRGKNGSSCRAAGSGARGSARFRPGTGERERSESAMDVKAMKCWEQQQHCRFKKWYKLNRVLIQKIEHHKQRDKRFTHYLLKSRLNSKYIMSNFWCTAQQRFTRTRLWQPCNFARTLVQGLPRNGSESCLGRKELMVHEDHSELRLGHRRRCREQRSSFPR